MGVTKTEFHFSRLVAGFVDTYNFLFSNLFGDDCRFDNNMFELVWSRQPADVLWLVSWEEFNPNGNSGSVATDTYLRGDFLDENHARRSAVKCYRRTRFIPSTISGYVFEHLECGMLDFVQETWMLSWAFWRSLIAMFKPVKQGCWDIPLFIVDWCWLLFIYFFVCVYYIFKTTRVRRSSFLWFLANGPPFSLSRLSSGGDISEEAGRSSAVKQKKVSVTFLEGFFKAWMWGVTSFQFLVHMKKTTLMCVFENTGPPLKRGPTVTTFFILGCCQWTSFFDEHKWIYEIT